MYTVLIAEDEHIERKALERFFEERFAGSCAVLTAENGIDTFHLCVEKSPDLALLDIEMPGITGIEAMREARAQGYSGRIIILTAYGTFEYARQAVECSVASYLLKPVRKDELTTMVERCFEEIRREKELTVRMESDRNKLKTIVHFTENNFFDALTLGNLNDARFMLDHGFLSFDEVAGRVIRATVRDEAKGCLEALMKRGAGRLFCECGSLSSFRMDGSRLILYQRAINRDRAFDGLIGFLSGWLLAVEAETFGASAVDVWISQTVFTLQALADVYALASAVQSAGGRMSAEGRINISEQSSRPRLGGTKAERFLRRLVRGINDPEEATKVKSVGAAAWDLIISLSPNPLTRVDAFCALTRTIVETLMRSDASDRGRELCGLMIKECAGADRSDATLIRLTKLCLEVSFHAGAARDSAQMLYSEPVSRAVVYIRRFFAQELSMSDVAESVGFSEYHFSRVFKQETGRNFIEYLTDIRIKHAKKLMNMFKLSVEELAVLCGYNSAAYFCRVFKRVTGLTVGEYKRRVEHFGSQP